MAASFSPAAGDEYSVEGGADTEEVFASAGASGWVGLGGEVAVGMQIADEAKVGLSDLPVEGALHFGMPIAIEIF